MSASGISLRVLGTHGEAELMQLHQEVWQAIVRYVARLAASDACESLLAYGRAQPEVARGMPWWGVTSNSLEYGFRDDEFAGRVWQHWVELAVAGNWQDLAELATARGIELVPGVSLAKVVAQNPQYVEVEGALWQADDDQLAGDERSLALNTSARQAAYARAQRACYCSPCRFLRPDPDMEAQLRTQLIDVRYAGSVAWYLQQAAQPAVETLDAAIDAGTVVPPRQLLTLVETVAAHHDVWARYATRTESFAPGARGLVLAALAVAATEANRPQLAELVRMAVQTGGPDTDIAAELLGRVGERTPETIGLLVALLERHDGAAGDAETRHSVVLALANLHLPKVALAARTRTALQAEVLAGGGGGKLAAWLLQLDEQAYS